MKLQLLEKAGQVIEAICNSSEPVTLKELSDKLQLPVPTLSRICNDLVEMRWIEKTDYHHFAPGLALIRFGDNAARLSPYAAAVESLLRDYAVKTGLNGLLVGYARHNAFKVLSCAQKNSDEDIFRRSGVLTALLSISGISHDDARDELRRYFPNLSEVELNTFDREFEKLQFRKLLLREGIMRQWYITVPFVCGGIGYALTFYGHGPKDKSVENACNEVELLAGRIVSAWIRIARQ